MGLLATRMLEYRNSMHQMDKWETRGSVYGAYNAFLRQNNAGDAMIPENVRREIMGTIGRDVKLPVLQFNDNITIGNTRTLTIADAENTSALYTVVWTTYSTGWTQTATLNQTNEISAQRDFNNKMDSFLNKMGIVLDNAGLAALEAAKSQVLGDTIGGKYTHTSNVAVGALATEDEIIGDVSLMLHGNDFYNTPDVVGNLSLHSVLRNRLVEQGTYNQRNKAYQYDDKIWHFSNRVANGAGHKATGFAVPSGSLGILHRAEAQAIAAQKRSRTGHEWGMDVLPMLDLPVATYYYQDVVDRTSLDGAASAHLDRVIVDYFGLAIDMAFVVSYNRDAATLAGPVLKFALAST